MTAKDTASAFRADDSLLYKGFLLKMARCGLGEWKKSPLGASFYQSADIRMRPFISNEWGA